MQIIYLNRSIIHLNRSYTSFIIYCISFKDLWLFNCFEGFQYSFMQNNFRLNKISKVFLTSLHINNISGLLGLLSSLNLIGRTKALHIYGPKDLVNYLDLNKKYSHTNFSYLIYIHTLTSGLILNYNNYRLYTLVKNNKYELIIIQSERYGTFFLDKAKKNHLLPGPLYGKLKIGFCFMLPDGCILEGYNFTVLNLLGLQVCVFIDKYYRRNIMESNSYCSIMIH